MLSLSRSNKSIIIGIDGADWRLITPWIKDGHLKHLYEIIKEGVRGTLISTIPPFTLPAWTSIFTGVNPGKHGITDNLIRIGDKFAPATSRYRKVPLLWSILGHEGLKSIVVNDPVTYPPEPINGIMTTGFLTPPSSNNYVYPPELKDEVDKASGGYMPELPLDYDKLIAKNRMEAYETVNCFAQKTAHLSLYLMKNHEWDIFNVTFTSTDRLQHFYWQDMHLLQRHYSWLDSIIRKIMDTASDENANILIISDHGFTPIHTSVHVNTALAREGLIQLKKGILEDIMLKIGLTAENLSSVSQRMGFYKLISKLTHKGLKQKFPSKYSRSTTGKTIAKLLTATGIFIKQDLGSSYESVRNLIIRIVLSIKDGNKNVINKIYKREDVLWGAHIKRAPDIFLIPNEGYRLSTVIKDNILDKPIQLSTGVLRTGEHRMEGIFVACGPNIRKEYSQNLNLNTWDITPLLLNLFRLKVPNYMDGSAIETIIKK